MPVFGREQRLPGLLPGLFDLRVDGAEKSEMTLVMELQQVRATDFEMQQRMNGLTSEVRQSAGH